MCIEMVVHPWVPLSGVTLLVMETFLPSLTGVFVGAIVIPRHESQRGRQRCCCQKLWLLWLITLVVVPPISIHDLSLSRVKWGEIVECVWVPTEDSYDATISVWQRGKSFYLYKSFMERLTCACTHVPELAPDWLYLKLTKGKFGSGRIVPTVFTYQKKYYTSILPHFYTHTYSCTLCC